MFCDDGTGTGKNQTKMDELQMTEARLQSECFKWFHQNYPAYRGLLFHVPNGGFRDPREAAKFKAMGVVEGVLDMYFLYKGRAYVFEFKRPDGKGYLSPAQKKMISILELHTFEVWLIEDVSVFKSVMLEILARPSDAILERVLSKDEYFYRHRVYEYLFNSLGIGQPVEITSLCEEDTAPKFCRYVVEFIEGGFGEPEGFEVLFTPDFKAIYKKRIGVDDDVWYRNSTTLQD